MRHGPIDCVLLPTVERNGHDASTARQPPPAFGPARCAGRAYRRRAAAQTRADRKTYVAAAGDGFFCNNGSRHAYGVDVRGHHAGAGACNARTMGSSHDGHDGSHTSGKSDSPHACRRSSRQNNNDDLPGGSIGVDKSWYR